MTGKCFRKGSFFVWEQYVKRSETFYNLIWIFGDVNIKVIYQNCAIKRHTLQDNEGKTKYEKIIM